MPRGKMEILGKVGEVVVTTLAFAASLIVIVFSPANAQIGMAGSIKVGVDVRSFSNEAFSVLISDSGSLKVGMQLAAQVGGDVVYSMDTEHLSDGKTDVNYPILAIVHDEVVWPAIMVPKVHVNAGQTIHSGGYVIQAGRAFKAGDHVLVLVTGGHSVLAIGKDKPWLTAFKENTKKDVRDSVLSAWKSWRFHPDI